MYIFREFDVRNYVTQCLVLFIVQWLSIVIRKKYKTKTYSFKQEYANTIHRMSSKRKASPSSSSFPSDSCSSSSFLSLHLLHRLVPRLLHLFFHWVPCYHNRVQHVSSPSKLSRISSVWRSKKGTRNYVVIVVFRITPVLISLLSCTVFQFLKMFLMSRESLSFWN